MSDTPTGPTVPEDQLPKDDFADDATPHASQATDPIPGSVS